MQILSQTELDFSDVLIKPRRSTICSRKMADIKRDYHFKWCKLHITGTGLMNANMGTIGTFKVAKVMLDNGLFTCLHKHHNKEELVDFYKSLEFLGGLRSTMTYIGASKLKDIPKCCVFYRVNNQLNRSYESTTIGK